MDREELKSYKRITVEQIKITLSQSHKMRRNNNLSAMYIYGLFIYGYMLTIFGNDENVTMKGGNDERWSNR